MRVLIYGYPTNAALAALAALAVSAGHTVTYRNPEVFTPDQAEACDVVVTYLGLPHTPVVAEAYAERENVRGFGVPLDEHLPTVYASGGVKALAEHLGFELPDLAASSEPRANAPVVGSIEPAVPSESSSDADPSSEPSTGDAACAEDTATARDASEAPATNGAAPAASGDPAEQPVEQTSDATTDATPASAAPTSTSRRRGGR